MARRREAPSPRLDGRRRPRTWPRARRPTSPSRPGGSASWRLHRLCRGAWLVLASRWATWPSSVPVPRRIRQEASPRRRISRVRGRIAWREPLAPVRMRRHPPRKGANRHGGAVRNGRGWGRSGRRRAAERRLRVHAELGADPRRAGLVAVDLDLSGGQGRCRESRRSLGAIRPADHLSQFREGDGDRGLTGSTGGRCPLGGLDPQGRADHRPPARSPRDLRCLLPDPGGTVHRDDQRPRAGAGG